MISNFIKETLLKIINFMFDCEFTIGGVTTSFGALFFFSLFFITAAKIIHVITNSYEDNY